MWCSGNMPGWEPQETQAWFLSQKILWKEMATHSSILAWEIPWVEEPGRLQSMGSLRVGHDWATSLSLFTFTFHFHALEKEMATHSSVLAWRIPGRGSLVGCRLWGRTVGHDWRYLAAAAAAAAVLKYPRVTTFFFPVIPNAWTKGN